MQRTTVVAEKALLAQVRSLARRRGVSASAIVRSALAEYVAKAATGKAPSFVGAGSSGGSKPLSERAEELLFEREPESP